MKVKCPACKKGHGELSPGDYRCVCTAEFRVESQANPSTSAAENPHQAGQGRITPEGWREHQKHIPIPKGWQLAPSKGPLGMRVAKPRPGMVWIVQSSVAVTAPPTRAQREGKGVAKKYAHKTGRRAPAPAAPGSFEQYTKEEGMEWSGSTPVRASDPSAPGAPPESYVSQISARMGEEARKKLARSNPPVAAKEPWQMTRQDLVSVSPQAIGKRFPRSAYRGELYDPSVPRSKGFLGNVYLYEGRGYVVGVEGGKIVSELPGSFDPKAFEKAGELNISAGQKVQYWRFKRLAGSNPLDMQLTEHEQRGIGSRLSLVMDRGVQSGVLHGIDMKPAPVVFSDDDVVVLKMAGRRDWVGRKLGGGSMTTYTGAEYHVYLRLPGENSSLVRQIASWPVRG